MIGLITTIVMAVIFIAMVAVNYYQIKGIRKDFEKYYLAQKHEFAKLEQYAKKKVDKAGSIVSKLTIQNIRRNSEMEKFIELMDEEYKKQIKQLEVNERFATNKLTEYYMAVRALPDNYKKKIQFQLDKMMDEKNGKEKDMPYVKPKEGEKK